jgi:ferrous iron transport protein A
MKKKYEEISLASIDQRKLVKCVLIDAGCSLKYKLIAMGLIPGTEIEVIKNSKKGPIIVMIKQSRIALGREVAKKIKVSE